MRDDKLFLNKKIHILLWSAICALTVLLSIPCIKDFYSEHEVREIRRSLCHVTNRRSPGHRYYPNTKTEVKISSY